MALAELPREFFEELEPLLPPEKPMTRRGGRPRVPHEIVMNVIWFVLVTGCRREDAPRTPGCSGRTAHR